MSVGAGVDTPLAPLRGEVWEWALGVLAATMAYADKVERYSIFSHPVILRLIYFSCNDNIVCTLVITHVEIMHAQHIGDDDSPSKSARTYDQSIKEWFHDSASNSLELKLSLTISVPDILLCQTVT